MLIYVISILLLHVSFLLKLNAYRIKQKNEMKVGLKTYHFLFQVPLLWNLVNEAALKF